MRDSQHPNSLGKYQLIASLGQGGMAKVYLALVAGPAGVNKLMVVKILENEMLSGPEGGIELFWDEARLAARLLHPNIVHTYDVGEVDGHYFLAMEYLDGQTYRVLQARAAQAPLPLHEELRILSEVARGLQYAHDLKDFHGAPLGVVHRDVSPANVFVTYDGQVKLIDFGIAKTHDAGHETRVGLIKGKLNYIAPEQLRGDPLDGRADVFALGVMLWEAVTGRRFAGGAGVTEVAKVHARIKGDEPNVRDAKPDVSEELATIIDRAIALERDQRFSDAASFADALDAYIEGTGQRPSAKTLSTWMHSLFEQDRIAMHKVIDERMQALSHKSSEHGLDDLPALPIAEEVHTGSGILKGRGLTLQGLNRTAGPTPAASSTWESSRDRKRLRWAAAGVGIVVAAAAAASWLSPADATNTRQASSPAAPQEAAPAASQLAAPPSALPAAAAAPDSAKSSSMPLNVTLSVTVSPPSANVSIDGAAIIAPFTGAFPKSATLHRIEATAPGYRPLVRLLPLNQDQNLELNLEPIPEMTRRSTPARARAGNERHTATASTTTAAPAEELRPQPSDEPSRPPAVVPGGDIRPVKTRLGHSQIDTSDPYSTGN
jgi:serine/threonine-protein kinase